jgi:ribosome-binding protein aMBF1 (putative translation factor)
MKMRHTDLEIRAGETILKFTNVPVAKIKPLITSLQEYSEESIPWREAAKDRIKASGGESAHMVKSSRQMLGLTQVELAKKLKMPQANLSQIENGKRPVGKALAKKLGKIFNVDYRVFL